MPTSEIGLATWVNWFNASVDRDQKVIDAWEVWNEPNDSLTPPDHARLGGDLGRDKGSSCLAIVDLKYRDEKNRKGLLRARDDRTVKYPQPAYYAVRNLAAVFDDRNLVFCHTHRPAGCLTD